MEQLPHVWHSTVTGPVLVGVGVLAVLMAGPAALVLGWLLSLPVCVAHGGASQGSVSAGGCDCLSPTHRWTGRQPRALKDP